MKKKGKDYCYKNSFRKLLIHQRLYLLLHSTCSANLGSNLSEEPMGPGYPCNGHF